jgi:hypothetical protein
MVLLARFPPEAKPAVNVMFAASHQPQHLLSVLAIGGFAQDLPAAFGHRVAADDDAFADRIGDVASLLPGEPGDQFWRRLAAVAEGNCWRGSFAATASLGRPIEMSCRYHGDEGALDIALKSRA